MEQMTIFDFPDVLPLDQFESKELFMNRPIISIDKPIRMIELFAGYGSQSMAMKRIGANFEPYKISEWCIPSVNLYHSVHCKNQIPVEFNYTKEDAVDILLKYGVSMDGKSPLTKENLMRKSREWLNDVISKFRATNNVGSICNIHACDLGIVDTHLLTYLLTYLQLSLPRYFRCW